jgi:hypothetical protein
VRSVQNDQHQAAPNRPDGLEPIFGLAVVDVVHLEDGSIRREQLAGFCERYAVEFLVSRYFFWVPFEASTPGRTTPSSDGGASRPIA